MKKALRKRPVLSSRSVFFSGNCFSWCVGPGAWSGETYPEGAWEFVEGLFGVFNASELVFLTSTRLLILPVFMDQVWEGSLHLGVCLTSMI